MSSLVPQFRRPGTNTTLGNHEARIRALERQRPSGAGDYVFLSEVSCNSDESLLFENISQEYRHLHVRVRASAYSSAGDPLQLGWGNGESSGDFWQAQQWFNSSPDDPTVPRADGNAANGESTDQANILGILPLEGDSFADITVEFNYYSQPTALRWTSCKWQAGSTLVGTSSDNVAHNVGWAMLLPPEGEQPLDTLELFSGNPGIGLGQDSIASMYGIR